MNDNVALAVAYPTCSSQPFLKWDLTFGVLDVDEERADRFANVRDYGPYTLRKPEYLIISARPRL
jgi:hypothetical protein